MQHRLTTYPTPSQFLLGITLVGHNATPRCYEAILIHSLEDVRSSFAMMDNQSNQKLIVSLASLQQAKTDHLVHLAFTLNKMS